MKNTAFFVLLVLAVFCALPVFAQQNPDTVGVIINHYAVRDFAVGSISKADLDRIIQAGIRAPSAGNRQPWHFTVVQNMELAKKIVAQSVNGNVLIVISAAGDGNTNTREIIDCALATQSIYLAAQALGYGSRIYTGPIESLNRNLRQELGLPVGHSAVTVIRVGKLESKPDAISAASSRNAAASMVTYK